MGMPCQVNSILKLSLSQGYPVSIEVDKQYQVQKAGYRILPMDVPLCLVDEYWFAHADIVINKLEWRDQITYLEFTIFRIYDAPFAMK